MRDLISIGRFARLTDLSPRLLRKLDERRLFSPAHVDPETHYRYYDHSQLRQANLIRLGRQLQLPLGEISRIAASGDDAALRSLLERHRSRIAQRLSEQTRSLALLEQELARSARPLAYECVVEDVPAQLVAGCRGSVVRSHPHDPWDLEDALLRTGEVVLSWLRAHGMEVAERPVILYYTDLAEDDEMRFEVCVSIAAVVPAGDGVRCRELPAVRVASTVHRGSYDTIWNAYTELAAWVADEGLEITGPSREVGLVHAGDTPDPNLWVTEIGFPI